MGQEVSNLEMVFWTRIESQHHKFRHNYHTELPCFNGQISHILTLLVLPIFAMYNKDWGKGSSPTSLPWYAKYQDDYRDILILEVNSQPEVKVVT